MRITIETIAHEEQRYPTVGDWIEYPNGEWVIRVSDMKDWRKELLVGLHELVEMALCKERGISEESVSAFDKRFEETRRQYPHDEEPGDQPHAPYRREHRFAENIERQIAHELGVDWFEYDRTVTEL